MTLSLGELSGAVRAKSSVTLNHDKVAEVMAGRVEKHFDQAVAIPVDALRKELEKYNSEMASLGTDKLSELKGSVENTLDSLNQAQRRIEGIERRVTFVGISRLALAVLPLFASLMIVGGLVWGLASMFGVGPLFGWAWTSFVAADTWWAKGLIALATLSGASLFILLALRIARWVYDELC